MDYLREELWSLRRESSGGGYFYPPSNVAELLTFDNIHSCLQSIISGELNQLDLFKFASIIRETNITTFAILLLNRDHNYIKEFLYRRETDSKIYYSEQALYFLPPVVAHAFVERQWAFHPVIFENGEIHRDISDKEILPFLEEEKHGKGGFGTVWKVKIHPNCQKLVPGSCQTAGIVIARKELEKGDDGGNERAVLKLLQTLVHPNIVQFYGSYTYQGVHNLLFPYVALDLDKVFLQSPTMESYVIYSGIYGLSDALCSIHDFSFRDGTVDIQSIGYHHDLRPANILVQDDIFMIADFGLSKLKVTNQDSKTPLRGGHDDYLAPEAFNNIDYANGAVGRALDVWAFGCILAEIATFIEGQSVAEFRFKRKATHGTIFLQTDSAFHLNGQIRPTVNEWLRDLVESPKDPQVGELVTLILEMLNLNHYRRMKMLTVKSSLAKLATFAYVSAIGKAFEKLSYDCTDRKSDFNVLVLLEHKKFDAWTSAFSRLHQNEQLEVTDLLLDKFDDLVTILASDEVSTTSVQTGQTVTTRVIETISSSVDSICATLSTEARTSVQQLWSREVSEIQDISILDAIRTAQKPDRYRWVGINAAMSFMSRAISSSIHAGGPSRYVDSGCVEIDEASANVSLGAGNGQSVEDASRTMGFYSTSQGKIRVLIEWKEYDTRWQHSPGEAFHQNMDSLVNLLDPNQTPRQGATRDRVLDCQGYFHEPRNYRFGFIYPLKLTEKLDAASVRLYSVNNIIKSTDPALPNTIRPDLGDIFQLAKEISSCLLALHEAGWFHKNISSHQLLAFSLSQDKAHQHLRSAVLAGFSNSRPAVAEYTLGPRQEFVHYQHPLYRAGINFRRSFDYFGLGIVLLELGLWLPISVLRDDHPEIKSADDFRQKLLTSYVPQLGERMGKIFQDAVQFCLDAEDIIQSTQEDVEGCRRAHDMFNAKVVEPISLCFA